MQDYIYTENLCKNYGSVTAINNLNLNVRAGEIFGFLGPNGAGKTTTIRVLTTLTRPTSGYVSVGGYDIHDEIDKVKKVIGVVQQHLSLDRDLTVRENMEFHARIQHLSSSKRKQRITELLEYVELTEYADKMIDTLSGGMKKKASIVCSLLHEPKLLFLDEPTVGLDAQARRRLWDLVRRLNKDGTTIFLTTHYIEEAEVLCDRVGIMHHGQLIVVDEPANLREKVGSIVVETLVDNKDTHYQFFANREVATNYVKNLPSEVKTVIIRESNLEDVFIEQTGEKVGDP
ncbi:ABC transporter ATP-binding protein [Candidatus Bathycorpusculum sp.]|uniref:ABC transporter ATP-binding protein n=1 Tax=Candidatus Bathycorpusculum sp. TaxID=2994959 RepID=UPI00282FB436|nr:ABC transporter ATP-binding protein [Candidatus Termitimicrobium sp.]MCL2685805.1 ABC transporter ATP-binding protein [Candidatus Termitimicrobium sp.]